MIASLSYPCPAQEAVHGRTLPLILDLQNGPCMDLAMHKGVLWSVGDGKLQAWDISKPMKPRPMGVLSGLGNVRQIECEADIAYVASREDGLFIVDIQTPDAPRLLYHYDTLEKATGIAVSGALVAVANRYYGVELVDVSNPRAPRYLSTALSGKEVQSVEIQGNILYGGIWEGRQVCVVDIKDPLNPTLLSYADLDGYGDGVRMRDGLLYAATGHHAASYHGMHYQQPKPSDQGYGEGHGIEVIDVKNPSTPLILSRLKTPAFYKGVPDMWSVELSGSFAVLSDTFNGVFLVDVAKPATPSFVGHARLPSAGGEVEPVTSVALGSGVIYAGGYKTGIKVFECPEMNPSRATDPVERPPISKDIESVIQVLPDGLRYQPEGRVQGLALVGTDCAALAVGNGGLHIVQLAPEFKVLAVIKTEGIAVDVALRGNQIFVAEMEHGLSVWELDEKKGAVLLGRYEKPGVSVQQIVASESTPYAVIESGQSYLEILDISDPTSIRSVLREKGPGIFYGKWICPQITKDNRAAAFWHGGGPVWYDLQSNPPKRITEMQDVVGNKLAGLWLYADGGLLALYGNGLAMLPASFASRLDKPEGLLPGGESLNGLPSARDNVLVVATSAWRSLKALDISDPLRPILLEKWKTEGNPLRVGFWRDYLLVPEGRGGLVMQKKYYLKNGLSARRESSALEMDTANSGGNENISIADLPGALAGKVDKLDKGSARCSDRFLFINIPKALKGLPVVTVARGDGAYPGSGYRFNIDRPAKVYLFVCQVGKPPGPEGWQDAGLEAEWTFKDELKLKDKIYCKTFPAGEVVIPENNAMTGNYGPPHACAVATE